MALLGEQNLPVNLRCGPQTTIDGLGTCACVQVASLRVCASAARARTGVYPQRQNRSPRALAAMAWRRQKCCLERPRLLLRPPSLSRLDRRWSLHQAYPHERPTAAGPSQVSWPVKVTAAADPWAFPFREQGHWPSVLGPDRLRSLRSPATNLKLGPASR